MTEDKKYKVFFAPGALDNFEGTQEELDEMVAEIQRLAESGEIMEIAEPLDEDSLEEDPELREAIEDVVTSLIQSRNRRLH